MSNLEPYIPAGFEHQYESTQSDHRSVLGNFIKYWSRGPWNATYTARDGLSLLPDLPACCHKLKMKEKRLPIKRIEQDSYLENQHSIASSLPGKTTRKA